MSSQTKEVIAQAVAEAARATIQPMAASSVDRMKNTGPRLSRPIMKQPSFNGEADDKYNELKTSDYR